MKTEYLGARASNAGDDFHEWWALRNALQLLTSNCEYDAVKVEGVNEGDIDNKFLKEWDAADCSLYYGGTTLKNATKVIVEQLKYSSATPSKNWTVSEFTKSKSKLSNTSIIRKLADTFSNTLKVRPDLISSSSFTTKFISNRPFGKALSESFSDSQSEKYEILRVASGLSKTNFKKFTKIFDYSDCGNGSRFEQEEKAISEIIALTLIADRGFVLDLKDKIHRQMLPEGTNSFITKETVLTWLNVSDPQALFPCPPRIREEKNLVFRNTTKEIYQALEEGNQFICIHGEGGSGKTTILAQVKEMLPAGSEMIIYDCYGAGTYLNSESYRHRAKEAYLQIINEVSTRLRLPLFINQSLSNDFVKAFKLRIESASNVLNEVSKDAIFVLVIDAADNSVTGAENCKPEEVSFIHELIKIGELPKNIRLVITARTGRLPSLSIPEKYTSVKIENFLLNETEKNVRNHYSNATHAWIEDFHELSNQNPRVQSYAFSYAGSSPDMALEYLRPNGKNLDQIFEEMQFIDLQSMRLDTVAELCIIRSHFGSRLFISDFY
jgi:energy-coupling factor transporter ATP-binding protein EcfA2